MTEPHHLRPLRLLRDISSSAPAFLSVMLIIMLASASCGYRLAGAKTNNGAGRTIAVPTFANRTTAYRVEQRVSDSVRREFVRRTQFKVVPAESGDVVVSGEVVDYVASPILFNEQGRASSYNISIGLKVVVTDTQSGAVLFQHDHWIFREVFELGQNSAEFVPEDSAAVDRLARRFASSLVASLLHRTP